MEPQGATTTAMLANKDDLKEDTLTKENFERHLAAVAAAAAAAHAAHGSTTGSPWPNSSFLIKDILFPRLKVWFYNLKNIYIY